MRKGGRTVVVPLKMADIFTPAKRSAVMAAIRGKGNKDTELRLMALMRVHGITGWRRGVALLGRPDFVFRRERVAVFVDGCFWHRHPGCKFAYTPKSRLEFWLPKFAKNVARDRVVTRALRQEGWTVLRVWECELAAGGTLAAGGAAIGAGASGLTRPGLLQEWGGG